MKFIKFIALLALIFALFGCASVKYKPIPEGYTGPKASIADSGIDENFAKAQMFVVAAIDGNDVVNSLYATRAASYGQGPLLRTQYVTREIQARPQRIKLLGTHITAAPIVALFSMALGSYLSVEGEIEFTPSPGISYVVVGELGKDSSAVWIEDARTNERVTNKIIKK